MTGPKVAFWVYEWLHPTDGSVTLRSLRPEDHCRKPDRAIPVPLMDEWAQWAQAAPAAPAPLTLREQLDARTPWDELEAILPQNEQDAERYRWLAGRCARLAEHWGGQWAIFLSGPGPSEPSSREAVDAAIDAAIEANKKEKA
jgi:hypothetical protein